MASEPIVKDFNVLKQIRFRRRFGLILASINQLYFQGAEETFGRSVIPTIAIAAHTRTHLVLGQQRLIIIAGILAARS